MTNGIGSFLRGSLGEDEGETGIMLKMNLYDESRTLQELSSMSGDDNSGPNDGIFLAIFFIVWNAMICYPTVLAIVSIVRCKCDGPVPILVCPHWIAGIIMPVALGYSVGGAAGAFIWSLSFVLPYSCGIYLEVQRMRLRTTLDEHAMDQFQLANGGGAGNGNQEGGDAAGWTSLAGDDRRDYIEQHLVVKRFEPIDLTKKEPTDQASRKIATPIHQNRVEGGKPKDSGLGNSSSIEHHEADPNSTSHETTCPICLEDYQSGDDICHSTNPLCPHSFHRDCVVDWLMSRAECPVCRRQYIGPVDNEEREDNSTTSNTSTANSNDNTDNDDRHTGRTDTSVEE